MTPGAEALKSVTMPFWSSNPEDSTSASSQNAVALDTGLSPPSTIMSGGGTSCLASCITLSSLVMAVRNTAPLASWVLMAEYALRLRAMGPRASGGDCRKVLHMRDSQFLDRPRSACTAFSATSGPYSGGAIRWCSPPSWPPPPPWPPPRVDACERTDLAPYTSSSSSSPSRRTSPRGSAKPMRWLYWPAVFAARSTRRA
mmetsp:Transcript_19672/g.54894  ORF Transcript_19672/g.54894 Transcript_19672/m.54894 type:complete len:200 (-) Transcript_19672:2084-2683(-)